MKHCVMKGSLRLYVVASEDMRKNQEVTIAHNSISDRTFQQKDGCVCRSKDCPFMQKNSQQNASSTELILT